MNELEITSALSAVVSLRSRIPEDALTANTLGTERAGHGVQIREDGLVLTIGYLVTEAESIFLVTASGQTLPAHLVAYDQETGFGLVQALGRLDAATVTLGRSSSLKIGDPIVLAGHGGKSAMVSAEVIDKREFAGYWEYLLDEAIFTAPAHNNWGGAAALDSEGQLVGIGSLLVQQAEEGEQQRDVNMVVPIDLLPPIFDDLLMFGRTRKPPRPWLGMLTVDHPAGLVVASTYDGGPADEADLEVGDIVVEVGGYEVSDLAEMFRRVWGIGEAGVDIPLTIVRNGERMTVSVTSVDRNASLKSPRVH
ncbi:MAG: S1C family serine protease [Pseudomonadota bacterium]